MTLSSGIAIVLGSGALGLAAGWLIERTHFCTMGAISDAYLFGSSRRLRAWLLAIAVALIGTQSLDLVGLVSLDRSVYLIPHLTPLAAIGGGLLFGLGMVLAGGCVSRNLVRLGAGSLKALVVVLILGLVALVTMTGLLAWPAAPFRSALSLTLTSPTQAVGDVLMPGVAARRWLGVAIGTALLVWILRDRAFRRSRPEVLVGTGLGLLVIAGYALAVGSTDAPGSRPLTTSLTYVEPTARTLLLMTGGGVGPGAGAALVLGTILGAGLSAHLGGRLRIEGFSRADDMLRHLAGAALMGFGGVVAGGCTIGQGMSGLATLAIDSLLAGAGIVVGALLALRRLEKGSWRAALLPGSTVADSVTGRDR